MRQGALALVLALSACGSRTRAVAGPATSGQQCDAGSDASALRALGTVVAGLQDDSSVTSFNDELAQALHGPCLRAANENPRPLRFDTAAQVKVWWERGGERWLHSFLPRHDDGVVLPPDVLPDLSVATFGTASERALVCPAAEPSCGSESAAWALRADQFWSRTTSEPLAAEDACRAEAQSVPAGERYANWRRCIETIRPRQPALPLGRLRAATTGWFVTSGRRLREHDACDELRVYSLDTGAAFVARTCGPRGSDGTHDTEVLAGHGSLDAVREAVWMSILAPHVVSAAQTDAVRFRLPRGIVHAVVPPVDAIAELFFETTSSSGLRPMTWAWVGPRKILATGSLSWPDSYRPGESYAAMLWHVAEASFQPGCVTATIPADLPLDGADNANVSALRSFRPEACTHAE